MAATNAVMMASTIWFVNPLDSPRPTTAPLNTPRRIMARTLAETRPLLAGMVVPYLGVRGWTTIGPMAGTALPRLYMH